jgi:hypothetical protein
VSFVSVTQQFNTSTSLGRLTLNILLSFAQFERELIGERTRDKMSAARRKGKCKSCAARWRRMPSIVIIGCCTMRLRTRCLWYCFVLGDSSGMASGGGFMYPKIFYERRKAMTMQSIWHDPVWSKVIASAIFAIIVAIAAQLKFDWLKRISNMWSIKLTITTAYVSSQPGAGYPLKYYVEMRNDSSKCVAVRILRYDSKAISLKSFPPEIMQVRFHTKWYPTDQGAETVAVLPGQLCRAWIGVDENIFTEAQVNAAKGNIGTLVLSVNRKQFSFEL